MAESVNGAGGSNGFRCLNGQFAIVDYMGNIEADKHGRAFGTLVVADNSPDS